MNNSRIVLPGGAGLVGQNLVARLRAQGYNNIVVLDKHMDNLEVLRRVQPEVTSEYADLTEPGDWQQYVREADVVVMLQAQIGGVDYQDFERNNVHATQLILDAIKSATTTPYLVHISSSVVNSVADDFYSRSKRLQEKLVLDSGIACPILRPTLMFGWFDRKHLGWLSRFMKKVPVFPIPGHGRYMRQPLYVGDFCDIIISCINRRQGRGIYNISGHEKIDYIDMICAIKRISGANTWIIRIPYRLFYLLLWCWALFDRSPPFTTQQLDALIAKDEFEVIDWPALFGVRCTPFEEALQETFTDPHYSHVVLKF
ncbi:MAG: NAD-dependent epimerase/dehydratase family protein [Pseudohongiella sp.]|nr:NAD-dependent epimerase/dehydratase family protein [Pseudohongiella sp.]